MAGRPAGGYQRPGPAGLLPPANAGGLRSLPYSRFRNNGPVNMGQPVQAKAANNRQSALARLIRQLEQLYGTRMPRPRSVRGTR